MRADVFCRVIDHFGDIGVAWRLVRQLQREHDWHIRLWVDDLKSFQRLEPSIALVAKQHLNGIEIINWTQATDFKPRPVVIATFSCDLPEPYLENLDTRLSQMNPLIAASYDSATEQNLSFHSSLWINLEYLSAENWVEGCHQLPSFRSDGRTSHFFFPGFTKQTGGLLRESNLIAQRDTWQADLAAQRAFLINLGLSEGAITALFPNARSRHDDSSIETENLLANAISRMHPARLVNLFCYDNAPVATLIDVLGADPRKTVLLIPEGIHPKYQSGQYGQLFLERVPFLPQTEYDKILWTADLNFVRGEDSIVRGLWAGKPFIWQIYPQTENTHLEKLQAWLVRSCLPQDICTLIHNWNPDSTQSPGDGVEKLSSVISDSSKIELSGYKNNYDANNLINFDDKTRKFSHALQEQLQPIRFEIWQRQALRFSAEQSALPDLASSLNAFCSDKQNL